MRNLKPLQSALGDVDSFATTLVVAAAAALGDEMLTWDPATVALEIKDELGVELPRPNANKLNAALVIVTTDSFYKELPRFIELCNTLWDGRINPAIFDPADAAEIAWGSTEALLLWPPDKQEENPFSDDIVQYIGHTLADEGLHRPPDILRLGMLPEGQGWGEVADEFSDEPEMYAAFDYIQSAKSEEIDELIRERLLALVGQLEALRLPEVEEAAAALARVLQNQADD